jgi:hypothetical protein
MNAPPKTLVKSRENLQAISADRSILIKYEAFDIILQYVWVRIKSLVTGYDVKTQYVINLRDLERHTQLVSTNTYITECIQVLKEEYPGVDITYRETAGYDGTVLERIIVMDWS